MNTIPSFLALIGLLSTQGAVPDFESIAAKASGVKDNQELARLANEAQEDRKPKDAKPTDWQVVGPKDQARRKRVICTAQNDDQRIIQVVRHSLGALPS